MNSLLCRICLEPGANLCIFENDVNSINSKIAFCMKEKIEDIDGYPRNICIKCYDILETFVNFIKRYKESSQILHEQFDDVKSEKNYEYEDFVDTEVEIDIKKEIQTDSITETFELEPVSLNPDDIKEEPTINIHTTKHWNTRKNKIASAILEDNFILKDNKWCIKTDEKDIKIKKVVKRRVIKERKSKVKKDPSKLCDLCGEVFPNADKLAHHKRIKHFRNPIKCQMCPKVLSSKYYLDCHIKRRHNTESKKFQCALCTISFAFKGELSSHIKHVHNKKDKPKKMFTCKTCGKVYKSPKSVIVHERSIHTGLRPAQCTVCGAQFYHDDYLREHMRLHTGETPYKCPICGRGYAQRGNMKSHLRNHKRSDLDPVTLSKIRPNYLKFMKP